MATARYETATTILNDALVDLGFAAVTNPFVSTDPNVVRLVRALTAAGRELVQIHDWQQLVKTHTITVAAADGRSYALPADFSGMVRDTGWNRTQDRAFTLFSPQRWAEDVSKANTPGQAAFRLYADAVKFVATGEVTDADTLAYEYRSKSWVMPSGQTTPTEDRVSATTDTVWFDPLLIKIATERQWKIGNSMDTTSVESAYWQAIERVRSAETVAPVLSIAPQRAVLGLPQAPERNWI